MTEEASTEYLISQSRKVQFSKVHDMKWASEIRALSKEHSLKMPFFILSWEKSLEV